ncbi:dihydropyrimidinase [Streptomyces sp. SID10853]|uniref:dihydropyrimidinase n=1 Tax=Streptomyces sp. SID10853 TaxID=2706028 RepID=UPI0013C0D106|nr:dihydropyrimidinase [Streptomyces sp. SID10853]NDZ77247.1 dihydropyrimidinase [Streptomyces sp. SID10853]
MGSLLLKGGTVWTSESVVEADVFVDGGIVRAIGSGLSQQADREIDVAGRILIPGGVDVHTHLDAPVGGTTTADDFESGTTAAACGGTTTIVDFATQAKGQTLQETVDTWHRKATGKAVVDFGFHLSITDLYRDAIADLGTVVRGGITSFKVFMGYPGTLMLNDGEIYRVMQAGARHGAQVCVHAENGFIIDRMAEDLMAQGKRGPESHALSRPPSTEAEAVSRAIRIARMADAPLYFVHLSTESAALALSEAQATGMPVAGETCTHYLTLDESLYRAPGFEGGKAVLTPPLRGAVDRDALWRGLRTGSLSVVSSDHCPFCFAQKKAGIDDFRLIPNGGPGIEHRLQLMYAEGVVKKRLTPQQFVHLTSTSPAKAFGLYPEKGTIAVGSHADITVLDPDGSTGISRDTHNMNVDYSLWEGWNLPGRVDRVFLRGDEIVRDGKFRGRAGSGQYLSRKTV